MDPMGGGSWGSREVAGLKLFRTEMALDADGDADPDDDGTGRTLGDRQRLVRTLAPPERMF